MSFFLVASFGFCLDRFDRLDGYDGLDRYDRFGSLARLDASVWSGWLANSLNSW